MILQAYPIIIPMPYNSAPTTDQEARAYIGMWIVLNAIWVISWVVTLIRFITFRSQKPDRHDWIWDYRWDGDTFFSMVVIPAVDLIMGFVWALIGIIDLGIYLSKYL